MVAGIVGIVMLVSPGGTDDYFSWPLAPEPVAALIGGFYIASAVVFALAIRRPWAEVRGLALAVLALAVPTFAATLHHSEVFDFSEPVAVIWLILFAGSPLTFGSFLVLRRQEGGAAGPWLPTWARGALGFLAGVLLALALLLWVDEGAATDHGPAALSPMAAKFLGAWAAFLSVLAGWAALRGRRDEAKLSLYALIGWPLGGLLAAATTFDDLGPDGRRLVYVLVLAGIAALAAAILALTRAAAAGRV